MIQQKKATDLEIYNHIQKSMEDLSEIVGYNIKTRPGISDKVYFNTDKYTSSFIKGLADKGSKVTFGHNPHVITDYMIQGDTETENVTVELTIKGL